MENNIKQYRLAAGMTQSDLGLAIGITSSKPQAVISNYEKGIRSPGLHACRRIVMALHVAGATMDSVFPVELKQG